MKTITLFFSITVFLIAHFTSIATAKTFTRPVKIILPAAASGSIGNEIRALAPTLEKNLGVSVILEYVVGAEGLIAYNKIYREKPDGYTIIYFNLTSPLTLELTRETAQFKVKNYTPICAWNVKSFCLVVHPERWQTFDEFLKEAKTKPISMASVGGTGRLQAALLEAGLGIKINYIPYGASGEALAAVGGRHVDSVITYITTPRPLIRAGKLRALAVLSLKPDPLLPDVPNFAQLGVGHATVIPTTGMLAAPPKTPKEMVSLWEKAVEKTLASPEFRKLAENVGIVIEFKKAAELPKIIDWHYEIFNNYREFLK